GKYEVVGDGVVHEVDYLDQSKEVSGADLIESLNITFDHFDMMPSLGSANQEWEHGMLHLCDACCFAWELSALHPLRPEDAIDPPAAACCAAALGRCPRCNGPCRPIRAIELSVEQPL